MIKKNTNIKCDIYQSNSSVYLEWLSIDDLIRFLWGTSLYIVEHLYQPINKFTWTETGFIISTLHSQICSAVRCQTVSRTQRSKSNQIKSNQIKNTRLHRGAHLYVMFPLLSVQTGEIIKYVCPHSFVLGGHDGLRQRGGGGGGGGHFFRVSHMTSEGSDEARAQIWMFS